jgi:predicted pore-forming effector associated with SMODS systems
VKRTVTVRVVAAVVVVVFVVDAWVADGELHLGWLKYFSAAVLIATVILALWDVWLWRFPLLQRIPKVPRCIRGTWKGTLTSYWADPNTATHPEPKDVYLVVRQTATLVSVKLLTDESQSRSLLAAVSAIDGTYTLDYLYLNRPNLHVEHRSRMHHGSAVLDIFGTPAKRLKGRYWTDRDTKGELDFTERHKGLLDDFDEAAACFL